MNLEFNKLKKEISILYPNATDIELTEITSNLIQFFVTAVKSYNETVKPANDN